MCGRYSMSGDIRELAMRFEFEANGLDFRPRYNIAPTQDVLTVTTSEGRQAAYMRWGLIPSWAKNLSASRPMINARAETVAELPSFRTALRQRRCLILGDGFYEWQHIGNGKRPMRIVIQLWTQP